MASVASGVEVFWRGARSGARPDPDLKVSEWADKYRVLTERSSPEPGPWRTSRVPYLREIMDDLSPSSRVEQVVVMAGSQLGKALALDTPIATVDGWTTMGEIQTGDQVFDENGQPCWVTGVSPVFRDRACYRVGFSDGSHLVADAEHRWRVWRKLGAMREELCARTTAQMLGDYLYEKGNGNEHRYSIDVIGPLNLPRVPLPIDPYLLGYWLGNGAARQSNASVHSADAEEIAANLAVQGIPTRIQRPTRESQGNTSLLLIDAGQSQDSVTVADAEAESRFSVLCKLLNLINNKHIPAIYQRAAFSDRLLLLQGLMDSDGSIDIYGSCMFSTSNPVLRDDVFELISGLGIKSTIRETPAKIQRTPIRGHIVYSKTNWRIRFTAYANMPVFQLARKRSRLRTTGHRTETGRRRIVSITPVESVPVRCIAVNAPSHLFAAGKELIVSHNTETGNNWLAFNIHMAPGPMMLVMPTTEMAKRNSKQRIAPLIEDCAALRNLVKEARSRDSGNTLLSKEFPGGILVMVGANSSKGLRSMPARYLFLDEVDGYLGDVDGEGEPCALAMARTSNFSRRKILITSTPKTSGRSRIERFYAASDQRQYWVPCPHCGELIVLDMAHLRWPKGNPWAAKYYCEACARPIDNHQKSWMLENGEWQPRLENEKIHGYHLPSLYSPVGWLSFGKVAELREKAGSDPELIKVFTNTVLGLPYVDAVEVPEADRLYERREGYQIGKVPLGGLVLTAGVDVQARRLEVEVVAWGRNKESWSVDYRVLEGETHQPAVWKQLAELLDEEFPTEYGGPGMRIRRLAVDSGFNTSSVYDFVHSQTRSRVICIKGQLHVPAIIGVPSLIEPGPQGQRIKYGIRLWPVNSSLAKEELYRWLRMPMPDVDKGEPWPVGYCHFPQYSKEYFEQLTAERLVTRFTAGRRASAWEKVRDRNEALDCRVYARAAAASMRIDTWQEPRWQQLEAALTVPVAAQAPAKPAQLQTNAVTVPKFQSFRAKDTSLD